MNNMERIHFINFVSTLTYGSETKSYLINLYDDIYNKLDSSIGYEHPTTPGNKHVPTGGSAGQILVWSSDGTAKWSSPSVASATTYGVVKQIPKMEVPAEATLENYGTFLTTLVNNLKSAGMMANE